MGIDNESGKSELLAEITTEAERSLSEIFARAAAAGVVSVLPYGPGAIPFGIGAVIVSGFTELAGRRIYERMRQMYEVFSRRLEELGEQQVNAEWFRGEEFQSLLFEILQQLRSIHDPQRIKLLGTAIANGGSTEFTEESRKEIFIRLVHNLTPQHVTLLKELLPSAKAWLEESSKQLEPDVANKLRWSNRPTITADSERLLILKMLTSDGLVEENMSSGTRFPSFRHTSSVGEAQRKLEELIEQLQKPHSIEFRLSVLGLDFLRFVGITTEMSPGRD